MEKTKTVEELAGTLKPLGTRVLVELDKTTHLITKSGIIIGDAVAPQSIRAKVLAIGPDVTTVQVGDTIFCGQYAPTEVKVLPRDETLMIPEEDILAVLVSQG